jgi:transcriptional regulator with XRE-family HTH domain
VDHADILKGALDVSGLSQAELARRLGVIRSRLHNWMSGHSPPPPAMLPMLCRELDLDTDAARRLYAACGVDLAPVLADDAVTP